MSIILFCTPASLLAEFGQRELIELTDLDTPRTNAMVDAVAQRHCDRANVEVAAAVAARYKPPLASVPELLKYLANDLAHFYLYQAEPPTWVQVRFDQARKTLREIQTGALPLGIDATGADATEAAGISDLPEMFGGAKAFGREAG